MACSKKLDFSDEVVEVIPEQVTKYVVPETPQKSMGIEDAQVQVPDETLASIGDELDADASRKRKLDEADAKTREMNKKSKLIEPAIFVDETSEWYPGRVQRIFKALEVMRKCKKSEEKYIKVVATFAHYIMLAEVTNFRDFIRKCSETLCCDQSHMYDWLKFISDPSATQDRFKRAVELVNGLRNKFMIPLLKDDEQFIFQ